MGLIDVARAYSPTFLRHTAAGGGGGATSGYTPWSVLDADNAHILIHQDTNTNGTLPGAFDIPVKINATSWVQDTNFGVSGFTSDATGRATYTGATTRLFRIMASCTMTTSAGSTDAALYVARDGLSFQQYQQRGYPGASRRTPYVIETTVSLAQNQYVELFLSSASPIVPVATNLKLMIL